MKRLLILLTMISAGSKVADAGHRSGHVTANSNCCQTANNNCQPSGGGTARCLTNNGKSTRWYKAKDGTFREMMPYMDALSRAEDADDMEIQLKSVQVQLETANSSIETVQADAAKLKAELESQIATLKQQLESELQAVADQKERGDKAEAAHKQCIEQIAGLRDSGRKSEETLKATQGELKKTTEERDSLKIARAELEQKLTDMTAAKLAAEEAAKVNQQELEKLKHDAAEAKKSVVESGAKSEDAPTPDAEKPATDGRAAPGEEVTNN